MRELDNEVMKKWVDIDDGMNDRIELKKRMFKIY